MITKLSEVVAISDFLQNWNGHMSRAIPTTNAKIQKYHSEGKDDLIGVVLFKLLANYDKDTYTELIKQGVVLKYQTSTFEVTQQDELIICKIFNKLGASVGLVHIDDENIRIIESIQLSGIFSTITSLFQENLNGKLRILHL